MAGLFEELKRRNVFRVGIAYLVAAWLLLQVVDVLLPIFELPLWAPRLIVLILVVGFVVALFVAWAYELTPDGIRREKDVDRAESITHKTGRKLDFLIIGIMALALAYFVVDKFILLEKPQVVVDEPVYEQHSIAVLPFVNMSDDSGNEYFSDGLSEEILNLLARIPGLKVIARTSSFSFKGRNEDVRNIGDALGVKTVLEGSVRKSGDRVRITAQLIDVSDGAHIWSDSYDRTMTDIFAVQDDVAAAIIDALQMHVSVNPTRGRPTENTEAYALFLKARAAINVLDTHGAEALLLKAIELDPNFAEAYEELVVTYWIMAGTVVDAVEAQRLVGEAASKALAIDPDLLLARTFYEVARFGPNIRLRKIQAFDRAAREQPDNPRILEGLISVLTENGYLGEALRLAERYIELDPLSVIANAHWSATLYSVGRTNDALAAMKMASRTELDPRFWKWSLEGMNLVEGQEEAAITSFESWLQRHDYPDAAWFRELVTGARDPSTGQAYLDRRIPQVVAAMAEQDNIDWQQGLTSLYLYFEFLDRHFELVLATEPSDSTWHEGGLHIWRGNIFRRLGFTAHPKYLELVNLLGIDDTWEQRGPPDFCEKVDGDWVCE